jgi:hypothetical protein
MISDLETWDKMQGEFRNAPGIYELRLLGPDLTNFAPLQRLLSVDTDGILYIGASLSLPARIASLRKGVSAAYGGREYEDPSVHPCGRKLCDRPRLKETCDFDFLCVMVEACGDTPESFENYNGHYKLEWERLQRYCAEFGEYPPLNG